MLLPSHHTKIVATIGPASSSQEVMEEMLRAGMSIARINLSHGDFDFHATVINRLRLAAAAVGCRLAILADLPGPKIRIGTLDPDPLELETGQEFTLTTIPQVGNQHLAFVSFPRLPQVVQAGAMLFLNDGLIQLKVIQVQESAVRCQVVVGGELSSRKGLNLPGLDLGISAFTDYDRRCLEFAARHGVDAVSQSFVENAADIRLVRQTAADLGYTPMVFAKIERARALDNLPAILEAADGIMIARGDLGVEIPIEKIAIVQKNLIRQANKLGKPVITATQMLESMTSYRRPTRAEATDVANAILDGTDCVMLSAESATGRYPVEAVAMLARIAAASEPHRPPVQLSDILPDSAPHEPQRLADIIAYSVQMTLTRFAPVAIFVPTRTGATARSIARFHPRQWIVAISSEDTTCQRLLFSYGVHPEYEPDHPPRWNDFVRRWLRCHGLTGNLAILTEGPSRRHPETNNRMELIDLQI